MCALVFSWRSANKLIPVHKQVKHVNLWWHSNALIYLMNTQVSKYFIQPFSEKIYQYTPIYPRYTFTSQGGPIIKGLHGSHVISV